MKMERTALMCGLAAALWWTGAAAGEFEVEAASYVGGGGNDDAVVGAHILSDGSIILLGDLAPDTFVERARSRGRGCIVRLSADGRKVISVRRTGMIVRDMSADGSDNLYIAADGIGLVKMNAATGKVAWSRNTGGVCYRVGTAPDGTSAVYAGGRVLAYDADGNTLGSAAMYQKIQDVCVDSASRTVITIGYRNARAFDGESVKPVQIAYLRGASYSGEVKWTGYDWSEDRRSPRFINAPESNMAPTRGYRASIGRDGRLYAAFEVIGSNHVFRYAPDDVNTPVSISGSGAHFSFDEEATEPGVFVGRYDPASGKYLAGVQFSARLATGKGSKIRVEKGDVTSDEHGRACLVGAAAYGLPLTFMPPGVGKHTGGGFVLVLSSGMSSAVLCTRLQPGRGSAHAVAARVVDGKARVAFGGSGIMPDEAMYTTNALQKEARGNEGFFALAAMAGAGAIPPELAERAKAARVALAKATTAGGGGAKKGPTKEVIARWDGRLVARVRERIAGGKRPRFLLISMGKPFRVTKVKEDGTLLLSSGPMQFSYGVAQLKMADRRNLALAAMDTKNAESCAIAAFYVMATLGAEEAEKHLEAAGGKAAEVRSAFE